MSAEIDARFLSQLSQQIPAEAKGASESAIRSAVETALSKAQIDDPAQQARIRDAVLGPAEAAGWKLDGLASGLGHQALVAGFASRFQGSEADLTARMTQAFSGGPNYVLPDESLGLKLVPIVVYGDDAGKTDDALRRFADLEFPLIEKMMVHFDSSGRMAPDRPPRPLGRRDPLEETLRSTHSGHFMPADYGRFDAQEHGYPSMTLGISFPDGNKPIEPASLSEFLAADVTFPADYRPDTIRRLGLPAIEDVMDLATGFRQLAGKRRIETRALVEFAENVGRVFDTKLDQDGMRALKTQLQGATDDIAGYQKFVLSYLGAPEDRDLGQRGPFMMRSLKQSLAAFAPD